MPSLSSELDLLPSIAKDSRGRDTVAVTLRLGDITTHGDVPAGASKGEDEAVTVSVPQAVANIQTILLPLLRGARADLATHSGLLSLEQAMIARAGDNFRDVGANAVLPVSRALWRAAARLQSLELFAYIRRNEPKLASRERVLFYMNIFNGGLHALRSKDGEILGRDRIDIQEIMIVPSAPSYAQALAMGDAVDQRLKGILTARFGAARVSRADEAGFSVKGLGDSGEALGYVRDAIVAAGFRPGHDVRLALDVAASSFYDAERRRYQFRAQALTTAQMTDVLLRLVDAYPGEVVSVEDGLAENDWEGWTALTHALRQRNIDTIGDDLFVTQLPRLRRGIEQRAASAILIKVNQNGTLHGTLEVMKAARAADMRCVVSHRSGETLDDSIADLAAATGAFGLKTGDPQPPADFPDPSTWVRRRKYLRMVEIEAQRQG